MQRHRFYAPNIHQQNSSLILDPEESHHLVRVLRLQPGATVFAFDGKGQEVECVVVSANKTSVELRINSMLSNEVESPLQLTLGLAYLKSDKFDWVVQKATELGVTRIVPLLTEHCELRSSDSRDGRLQRWQRIALEATKQSGRRTLNEVESIRSFQEFCENEKSDIRLIFSENIGEGLSNPVPSNSASLIIGPEGGWSPKELVTATKHGYKSIRLGNRILRAETAAVAAISLVQFLWGDLTGIPTNA